jgi:hypothetical protein
MATKKKLFDEDFLKVKSNVPSLRPNESAKSFKKRVQMWSSRTGLKLPTDRYSSEGRALLGLGQQPLGTQDYTSGYIKELNELVQRQNRRVTANTKAEEKLDEVPKSGFSDLRGELAIKKQVNVDEEGERDSKIMSGDELMTKYFDPNNPDNDYDVGKGEMPLGKARDRSFDPDNPDAPKIYQGSDSAAIDAGDSKSLQQQLKIRPDGMSQIEFENRRRFGDTHVQNLIDKNVAFQAMKRGEISKQQFADEFKTSNVAKRLKKLKIKKR